MASQVSCSDHRLPLPFAKERARLLHTLIERQPPSWLVASLVRSSSNNLVETAGLPTRPGSAAVWELPSRDRPG
jgi:hypothetical protein